MNSTALIITLGTMCLLLIVTVVILMIFVGRSYRKLFRTAKQAAEELGATSAVSIINLEAVITGTMDGRAFECRLAPPMRQRPRQLTVTLPGCYPHSVTVRRQTGFDALVSRTGMVRKILTGDQEFDATWFIDAVNRDVAGIFFTAHLPRIKALLSCPGVTGFSIDGKGIRLILDNIDLNQVTGQRIRELLATLATCADGIELPAVGASREISSEKMTLMLVLMTVGLLILGIAGQKYTHNAFPHLDESPLAVFWPILTPTLMLYLLMLGGLYLALRDRSDVHTLLVPPAILGPIALFMLCQSGYLYLNAVGDRSAGETHRITVTRLSSYKGHYLYCRAWDGRSRKLMVSRPFYETVHEGDKVDIQIKPGHLGTAWIAGYTKANDR